jgi:3-aminobutyryl-CoA ammonia-lyase
MPASHPLPVVAHSFDPLRLIPPAWDPRIDRGRRFVLSLLIDRSISESPSRELPLSTERAEPELVARVRLRLGPADAHYAGDLVAGATAMALFGDLETELAIRIFADEGLCVAYHSVDFLAPLRVGDFVEGSARIVSVGNTSRRVQAELYKVIETRPDGTGTVLDPPVLAARAEATIVSGRREKKKI